MKRAVCLILALVLGIWGAALAEYVPSKSVKDLTRFELTAENQIGDPNIYLLTVNGLMASELLPEMQKAVDLCNTELEKLKGCDNAMDYFGIVTDAEGNPAELTTLLGVEGSALKVFEFCPIIAGGFREDCGKVTAQLLFSTPYEPNQQVVVLIGLAKTGEDGTQSVAWHPFEGVGMERIADQEENHGCIRVEFTPEIVNAIQSNTALMAVVSK